MDDKNHCLSFLVAANMPVELKSSLFPKLEMIYPNALKNVDTALEGQNNTFPSAHYSFWFKYGRRVRFFLFFWAVIFESKCLGRCHALFR